MNTDGQQEDADEGKIENGMNQNGDAAGLEIPEFHETALAGHLNQQSRG